MPTCVIMPACSAQAVQDANGHIDAIKEKRKKDLIIETFKTAPENKSADVERMSDKAKSEFFAGWAAKRSSELELDGVYVLICKQPSYVFVAAGAETRKKAFTPADITGLRQLLVDRFKAKEFDRGLREGVTYVRNTMKGNVKQAINPDPQPVGKGLDLKGWLCTAIVVLGVVWVVIALVRGFSRSGQGAAGATGSPGFGGGGGFMSGMLGGLFGAVAGNWLYHNMFGGGYGGGWGGSSAHADEPGASDMGASDEGRDFTGSGGDFGDSGGDAGGGGDWGGGGDFGGGGGDY